jgi:cytochrome c-type biogenesis protein CcmH
MTQHWLFSLGCFLLLLLAVLLLWLPFRRRRSIPVLLAVLAVPVVALALYWHWGSPKQLLVFWQKQQDHRLAQVYLKQQKDPQAVLKQFVAMLEADPKQPKGWYLLGNIYVKQNKLEQAQAAYRKAHHYDKVNPRYLMALCQVDMGLHQQLARPLYEELSALVQAHPDNGSARYLLAFAEFNRKNYPAARQQWERVLSQLPPESKDAKQVLALIAKTQRR